MAYYYLEVVRGIDRGKRYELGEGAAPIGRTSQSAVALNGREKAVSAHHAILYVSADGCVVQDFQSTNGTFVNDERIEGEREVHDGDMVGLGKTGPRLKFMVSETKLPLSTGEADETDDPLHSSLLATDGEPAGLSRAEYSGDSDVMLPGDPSVTEEFERKLREERMGATDMHRLMKDGKRVERLLQRHSLSNTHRSLLASMYGARRRLARHWMTASGVVLAVSAALVGFFGLRAAQYRSQLQQAHLLEQQLDVYEDKIASARESPDGDSGELHRLIGELHEKENAYSSLRQQLDDDDFRRYYEDPLERELDAILAQFGETDYHVPPAMLERVRHHVDVYSGRMKPTVARYLDRKQEYFPMIERVLAEKNLPPELAYLSMLESGLNPRALSHAGARGLWQFMPKTARAYHLRVDKTVDERLDPHKSTRAAAEYIKDLIGIFGGKSSVMLAMAAYNAGEGRLMGALRKIDNPMQDRDFWYLYRMGFLAEETNEYIPRVLALIVIDKNRTEYGFAETSPALRPAPTTSDSRHAN
ncbi:MAG: transglycosylase SLT domain-containing protein [Chitinivibrionales bacterium]|nr:transglycosylase SLT domain-containing protein [Chitinivibrionales bacterium]